jgi:hypothetical protein
MEVKEAPPSDTAPTNATPPQVRLFVCLFFFFFAFHFHLFDFSFFLIPVSLSLFSRFLCFSSSPLSRTTFLLTLQKQSANAVTQESDADKEKKEKRKREKKAKQAKKKAAFKKTKSTNSIYITGLPLDITPEELLPFFAKCGVIKKDPETAQPIFRIYVNEEGKPKGDGRVTYYRPESVPLAIQILDGAEIRPGFPVKVSEAVFEQHAEPKGPKKPKAIKKKIKLYDQEKELTWDEDDNRHLILKHMFTQEEAWVRAHLPFFWW